MRELLNKKRELLNKKHRIMDQQSYSAGLNIGQQLVGMGIADLPSLDDFLKGIKDAVEGAAEKAKKAEAEGKAFLEANAKKEGVIVLPSGLQYMVLKEGTGKNPGATSQVKCHYAGTLIDGTEFDSSYKRNAPATFGLNQVIKGWTEGVQLMKEGAKYRFFIPYELGYGAQGAGGSIPPYSALIFDVELIEVL